MSDQAADVAAPATAAAPTPASAPTAVAPAAAPVVPAQDAAATPTEGQDQGPQPVEWAKTGDAGLDMALGFIGTRGFGPQHPAVQAAVQGDFSLLRAELAGMGDKATGYEAYVALAEKAYQADKARAERQYEMSVQAVTDVVGGTENWQAIHQWAKAQATPEERDEINRMMDGGPRSAKAAALYLKSLYENAHGTLTPGARVAKENASGHYTPTAGGPITDAREYARAVLELEKKVGKANIQDSPEYRQLQQRRLAGRRAAR